VQRPRRVPRSQLLHSEHVVWHAVSSRAVRATPAPTPHVALPPRLQAAYVLPAPGPRRCTAHRTPVGSAPAAVAAARPGAPQTPAMPARRPGCSGALQAPAQPPPCPTRMYAPTHGKGQDSGGATRGPLGTPTTLPEGGDGASFLPSPPTPATIPRSNQQPDPHP
jgi:hypothetical protein